MRDSFWLALGFLTRLPVPFCGEASRQQKSAALLFYPIVGLLIGGVLWFGAWLMTGLSPLLAGAIVVALWVGLTGGLHLDGLADCADAWAGGAGDADKTADIMKDPHLGAMAVVLLILVLILKTVAVAELIEHASLIILIVIPALARCSSIALFVTTDYVRSGGLGEVYVHSPDDESARRTIKRNRYATIAVTGLLTVLLLGFAGGLLILFLGVAFGLIRQLAVHRLGGFTGDVAGAMIELIELFACLFWVVFLGW